jgi:uncharacterized membrane protein
MASKVEDFLTAAQEQAVVDAIRKAEMRTSGEIRVHLEAHCQGDVYQRAQQLFHLLKMDNTKLENGILIYVAVEDRKFAVLGDRGIHQVVGSSFWVDVKEVMQSHFKQAKFEIGIITGIELVGERLATHFPWNEDDANELPDEITTS